MNNFGNGLISILTVLIVIAITTGICGLIGIITIPYSVNTWCIYLDVENFTPVSKTAGFWIGCIPGVGQITIPVAIVTMICDLAFIPDGEVEVVDTNNTVVPSTE